MRLLLTLSISLFLWTNSVIAGGASGSIETEGNFKGGFDSNVCALRIPHPSPSKETCDEEKDIFWGVETSLDGKIFPTSWFGMELSGFFEYRGMWKSSYILEPSAWLGGILLPREWIMLNFGLNYTWFQFHKYPSSVFHELSPSIEISTAFQKHTFTFIHSWQTRWLTHKEEFEWERSFGVFWKWNLNKNLNKKGLIYYPSKPFTSLHLGALWSHQEGEDEWRILDQVNFPAGVEFHPGHFLFEGEYSPGFIRFKEDSKNRFFHELHAAIGYAPLNFLEIYLSYNYEELFSSSSSHGNNPSDFSYSRHELAIVISFNLDWQSSRQKISKEKEILGLESPVSCDGQNCIFKIKMPKAKEVYLIGSFDEWSRNGRKMKGPDSNGVFELKVHLPPGRHRFIFVVDGKTVIPPAAQEYENDDLGGVNAVVTVPLSE